MSIIVVTRRHLEGAREEEDGTLSFHPLSCGHTQAASWGVDTSSASFFFAVDSTTIKYNGQV